MQSKRVDTHHQIMKIHSTMPLRPELYIVNIVDYFNFIENVELTKELTKL